jgi:hypothetical protein
MLNSWYNTKDKGYHKAQRNKNTSSTHNGSKLANIDLIYYKIIDNWKFVRNY